MYITLKNIKTGAYYYCKRSEYYRKGTRPHKTYTGIAYLQDSGFEIIGYFNTENKAIKSLISQSNQSKNR